MSLDLSSYHTQPLRTLPEPLRQLYYHCAATALEHSLTPSAFPLPAPTQNLISILNRRTEHGGTGLLLNEYGFLLTSYHLVNHLHTHPQHLSQYAIRDITQTLHPIDPTFFAADKINDLALLRSLGTPQHLSPLTLSSLVPEIDDPLTYFSFIDGKQLHHHSTQVYHSSYAIISPRKNLPDALTFVAQAQHGHSGSPIFNSDHHLVGILSGGGCIEDDTNDSNTNEPHTNEPNHLPIAFASKAIYIAQLLQEVITHLNQHPK